MPINQLYHTWIQRIRALRPSQRITQVRNLTWLLIGIYHSRSVNLSRVAGKIPGPAKLLSTTRRLSRWLANPAIRVREWYAPIARQWLAAQARHSGEIRLLVDGTKVGFRHQLLMVSVAYRRRAIPIAWTWVPYVRGHSAARTQLALFAYVAQLLPEQARVALVGDSEFGAVAVLRQLDTWGWHYVLRQKGRTHIRLPGQQTWQDFASWIAKPGQSRWLGAGFLTEKENYPTQLLVHWQVGETEPWCLATNLPTRGHTLRYYKRRMWIEIVCTQMTKTRDRTLGAGWDDIADFDFFIVDDHAVNQQFHQLSALFEIQTIQGGLNSLAKFLDVVCQCQSINLLLSLVVQLAQLLLEAILRASQFPPLALKFSSQDDFRQIHFQETRLLPFQARQGLTNSMALRLQGLRQPFSGLGAFQLVGNQGGVSQDGAQVLPDQFVQLPDRHIAGGTAFALSGSMNVSSPSTFVIVVFPLGATGRRQATLSTTDQTPEKIMVPLIIAPGHILVFLQTSLGSSKYFWSDNGWHRDRNPLFWRGRLDAFPPSHWQQSRFALAGRHRSGAATIGCAGIGRRTQHTPNSGWVPARPAARGGDLLFIQLLDHPVQRDRRLRVSIPSKDLPHNIGFDGIYPHPIRVSRPFRIQDIAIRSTGPRQQGAGAQFGLASTPHPFRNQVALIFGHCPTNLQQELIMGIIIFHRAFQKLDITTQVVQFFDQQNLMYIFASQPIRGGDQHPFESGHAGSISQPIQTWTIEFGPSIPIIAINMRLCQLPFGMLGYGCSQTLQLLFNALTLHLTIGRYSSIEGDLHNHSPDWVIPWIVDPRFGPSSSAEETDRCNPSDVAHPNILRLCDELAILFSCLLLNSIGHLGEDYPKFLRAQPQWAAPPRQLQLAPACQAEFVICDQTIDEMFGDLKGHGFDLESTMLRHFLRLSRLTLAVVLLYVWLLSVGTRTIHAGLRPLVDRRERRDLCIFQIGLRFIERRLINGQSFRIPLCTYR